MFNVIRLPTKYSRTIKRFSEKEKSELLDTLINIGAGIPQVLKDDLVGDTIALIYGDWIRMESKNGVKPEKPLIRYSSESLAPDVAGMSPPIVQYNTVQDNTVQDNIELPETEIQIATKVATLESYIKKEFDLDFISNVYDKYNLTKTDFQEECESFLLYWKEKSINGKKERWEKEKTFDPKLRFRNWMKNNDKWGKTVIVNIDDDENKRKLEEIERKKRDLFSKF